MPQFTIEDVCLATTGVLSARSEFKTVFLQVSTDTRNLVPGALFIALIGEHFDGHNFVAEAVEKGAAGVVVSRPLGVNMPNIAVITVPDTRRALQDLALFYRQRFSIPIIAITGSNGKTTTKDMTAAVLGSRFPVLKTEANFNNEIGLPLTLLNLSSEHQAAVVELGMRGLGEIKELADIARPTIAVVTNVGETHIERLGSIDAIAQAKGELVEAIADTGIVVLNSDNPYVREMGSKTGARKVYYGLSEQADIRAERIINRDNGIEFVCVAGKACFPVQLTSPGRHNVYNALAAIAVGLELGLTEEEIRSGLLKFTAGSMRLHIERRGDFTIINDAYNASPLSMAAAVDTLNDVAPGRKIAVLGDMLELGDFAEKAHRQIGAKLAERNVDAVITVGALSQFTAQAAKAAGVEHVASFTTHIEACNRLKEILKPGDTLLLKGSRGMKMEKIMEMF